MEPRSTAESETIRIPVALFPAAREHGREPHFITWAIIRHLAGDRHDAERKTVCNFVDDHELWSRSRFNAILREAEDDLWWFRTGRLSGAPLVTPRGLKDLIARLLAPGERPSGYRMAEIPVELLHGVAARRSVIYEALTGRPVLAAADPQSRLTQRVKTGVPASTQRRWNRLAGTERLATATIAGIVPDDYVIDPKYLEGGFYRVGEHEDGRRLVVRQLGNVTQNRFSTKNSVRLRHAAREALSKNGESELRLSSADTRVRYVRTAKQYLKLDEKGFDPRLRDGVGLVGTEPVRLYTERPS